MCRDVAVLPFPPRIADRVQTGCYAVEDKFGDAFVKLLDKFGLQDYSIADAYFKENPVPRDSFSKVLSYLRGDTIHAGYLDIGETLTYETVAMIFNHLYDIMVRIVLKKLGYNWVYQTAMGYIN